VSVEGTLATVEGAAVFAATVHAGQVDRAGQPYILHVLRVGGNLGRIGPEFAIAGLLHDTLEDTRTTVDDLRRLGASEAVISAVLAVTSTESESTLESYERSIRKAAADPIGLVVKAFDVQDNAGRLSALPDPVAAARLQEKYLMASTLLAALLAAAGWDAVAADQSALARSLAQSGDR